MASIHASDPTEGDGAQQTRPRHPSRPRRSRYGIVAAGVALVIVAAVATIGVEPGHGPGRVQDAGALQRLARVALDRAPTGTGTVVHTISISDSGSGLNTLETWIAPDGSGRMKDTNADTVDDERYPAGGLSYTDLAGWPTDVAGVVTKLRAEAGQSDMRPVDAEAFVRAGDYLVDSAAPADVRAAIFGAVAQLHGVRALGMVTDHRGRAGIGYEIDSDRSHNNRWELIFDPKTSALLSSQEGSLTGGYTSWVVYTRSELVPAIPPGGTPTG